MMCYKDELETVQVIKKQYGYVNVKNDGCKIFKTFLLLKYYR